MSLTGHVQNGVVVFDTPNAFPDGTAVKVEAIEASSRPPKCSLLDRLGDVVGKAESPPPHEPFLTEEICAPFDIPWPKGESVVPIAIVDYLPESHDISDTE